MWTFLSPRYGKPDVTPLIVYTYYNIWLILGVYFPLISNTLDRKKKTLQTWFTCVMVFFIFKGVLNKLHTTTNIPIPRAFHKINFVDTIVSIYI